MTSPRAGHIPYRANLVLSGALVAAHAAALVVLPLVGAGQAWLIAALALVAAASPALWSLIHEAIHGVLLPARPANDRLARLLAILFGAPFRALRFAHLRHHRYSRTPWGREEVYDATRRSPFVAHVLHYLRITFGLYAGELALNLMCWLPASVLRTHLLPLCPNPQDGAPGMAPLAERELLSRAGLWQMRVDASAVIALYGSALFFYGRAWPWLVACLMVRGFFASQIDHAPHHATPLDQRDYALNMPAPRWLQAGLLNFNLHRTHHQHPNLPWTALPQATELADGDIPFVRAVLRQWRGPVELAAAQAMVNPTTAGTSTAT